ncbi:hypothetical protein OCE25_26235 [Bacillus cereus]|nr:hypothetical protein [Bacillus cereus]
MKKRSRFIIFLVFIFVLIISFLYFFTKDSFVVKPTGSEEGRLAKSSNNLGYGMYGQDGKIIDNGSILEVDNTNIHSKLSLSHLIDNGREYKIIVMNNFRQVLFGVDGEKNISYDFYAKPNTIVDTTILNEVDKDIKEVDYLIIKKPNFLLEKFDPEPIGSLQQILSLRYNIENKAIPFRESIFPLFTSNKGPIDSVFISETKDKLNALTSAKSGQDVYLTVGNISNEVIRYALVALLDWEQVPLIDDEFIHYVTVNPNEKKVYQLKLPETEVKKNYQVLAFPFPYEVSNKKYTSQSVEASIRTVIKP